MQIGVQCCCELEVGIVGVFVGQFDVEVVFVDMYVQFKFEGMGLDCLCCFVVVQLQYGKCVVFVLFLIDQFLWQCVCKVMFGQGVVFGELWKIYGYVVVDGFVGCEFVVWGKIELFGCFSGQLGQYMVVMKVD